MDSGERKGTMRYVGIQIPSLKKALSESYLDMLRLGHGWYSQHYLLEGRNAAACCYQSAVAACHSAVIFSLIGFLL